MLKYKYGVGIIKKYAYWLLGLCVCLMLGGLTERVDVSLNYPEYRDTVGEEELSY